jgi:MFS family permease
VVFGALSDKIGRKPIILGGCLLAALTYFPIFKAITHYVNSALAAAAAASPVTVVADPKECSFQFVPAELKGQVTFTSSCDLATVSWPAVTFPTPPWSTARLRPLSSSSSRRGSATRRCRCPLGSQTEDAMMRTAAGDATD